MAPPPVSLLDGRKVSGVRVPVRLYVWSANTVTSYPLWSGKLNILSVPEVHAWLCRPAGGPEWKMLKRWQEVDRQW